MKNCASPLGRGFRGSRLPTAELEMEFYSDASLFSARLQATGNYGTPQTRGIRYTNLPPVS